MASGLVCQYFRLLLWAAWTVRWGVKGQPAPVASVCDLGPMGGYSPPLLPRPFRWGVQGQPAPVTSVCGLGPMGGHPPPWDLHS